MTGFCFVFLVFLNFLKEAFRLDDWEAVYNEYIISLRNRFTYFSFDLSLSLSLSPTHSPARAFLFCDPRSSLKLWIPFRSCIVCELRWDRRILPLPFPRCRHRGLSSFLDTRNTAYIWVWPPLLPPRRHVDFGSFRSRHSIFFYIYIYHNWRESFWENEREMRKYLHKF